MSNIKNEAGHIYDPCLIEDLESAKGHLVDLDKNVVKVAYSFTYQGNLFFTIKGESLVPTLQDVRGKGWESYIRGGEYLKVKKEDEVVWEGILVRDLFSKSKKDTNYSFVPRAIEWDTWLSWFNSKDYEVTLLTNNPVEKDLSLDSVKKSLEIAGTLKKYLVSKNLNILKTNILNQRSTFQFSIKPEDDVDNILKDLKDFNLVQYDGYSYDSKERVYRVVYCLKSEHQILRDGLLNHLISLGLKIKSVGEIEINSNLLISVETEDVEVLKSIESYKDLIFDGYSSKDNQYDLVFVYKK